jgi:hypothetical protein
MCVTSDRTNTSDDDFSVAALELELGSELDELNRRQVSVLRSHDAPHTGCNAGRPSFR